MQLGAFSLKYLLFLEEYEQSKKKGHTFTFALHASNMWHCQALGSPLELMTPKHPQLLQVLNFLSLQPLLLNVV
jgi:hypothetical protein